MTPTVVQKQLRHSDARITLGIYGHVVGNQQRDAVEKRAARIAGDGLDLPRRRIDALVCEGSGTIAVAIRRCWRGCESVSYGNSRSLDASCIEEWRCPASHQEI